MRVLVAEDERISRVSLVRQLESWGHSVTGAEDGQAAWEEFGKAAFDIVITDWEMPRLSGVELVQRIRAAGGSSYVYVILLTGRSDKSDIVSGIESGADDFVSKPFDRAELRARLLAGERVVRLERTLHEQNVALRAVTERLQRDMKAAARVQRAMLPRAVVQTARVRTAWKYVPTDELAGDAIGIELLEERYLVTYVADVSGHGVPAALLSVTAMHAMSPTAEGVSVRRVRSSDDPFGPAQLPSMVLTELNRRFSTSDNDGRFLTMILCILDTHDGRLCFARAGHPMPIVLSGAAPTAMDDEGDLPIGVADAAEYRDVQLQLAPGDRFYIYSDGIVEELDQSERHQFGAARLEKVLTASAAVPGAKVLEHAVDALTEWAGGRSFADDVSLVCVEWVG